MARTRPSHCSLPIHTPSNGGSRSRSPDLRVIFVRAPRTRALVAAIVLTLAGLQACTGHPSPPARQALPLSSRCTLPARFGPICFTIPAHYDTIRRAPLVIVLHGHGESAANFEKYTGMSSKADAEGFIVVYPQALGDPSDWHTAIDGPRKRDDIAFVREIINQLERTYRIDHHRIFAAGHSNGGIMTYRLASTLSDKLAAIGVTAGSIGMVDSLGDTLPYRPTKHPVSVIHFHGLADPSVPYAGGPESDGPDNIVSVKNTIAFWVAADHCPESPQSRTVSKDRNVDHGPLRACARVPPSRSTLSSTARTAGPATKSRGTPSPAGTTPT